MAYSSPVDLELRLDTGAAAIAEITLRVSAVGKRQASMFDPWSHPAPQAGRAIFMAVKLGAAWTPGMFCYANLCQVHLVFCVGWFLLQCVVIHID